MSQPLVSLTGVSKSFGEVDAVVDLNLQVNSGEFFSMLGPSGSGKTTVLRLIAGFETVSAGKITIADSDVTDLAPFDRPVNTVFQDYALFPHMSIQENVEYGLRTRKVPKATRAKQAAEADLGAGLWQTFRLVTFPQFRTSFMAGALLAFALSFDEVVVTIFTAPPGVDTLPLWILKEMARPNQGSVVNVVATVVILLSLIPVYVSQRLTRAQEENR